MNTLIKSTTLILFTILFTACTNKQITIKSLQPSKLGYVKVNNIILEEFENDNINQANNLEEVLVNKVLDGNRVFNLMPTYKNIDAIVTGKVIQSTLDYDFYYDEEETGTCAEYDKKTKECSSYKTVRIPCEDKRFYLKTQIQVLDKKERILFSKIYTRKDFESECNKLGIYNSELFYNNYQKQKDIYRVNSKLSLEIAKEAVNDISPYYLYEKISIITSLKNEYPKEIEKEFENIIELLDSKNIVVAQEKLEKLNYKLNNTSHEVLYNLALTLEARNEIKEAKTYLVKAKSVCKDIDDLKLIDDALNRIERNKDNRKKALYQLY